MYSHLKFIEKPSTQVNSWGYLHEDENQNYQYSTRDLPLNEIKLNDEGLIQFGGDSKNITQEGFQHFCKLLKIPDPFAEYIPFDLLQRNIERIGNERASENVTLHFKGNMEHLVNITNENYVPVPYTEILPALQEKTPEITRAIINDVDCHIDTVNPELEEFLSSIEPEVGDITKIGFNYNLTPLGFHTTQANLFLYRLVCENGMIAPRNWGFARMRTKLSRPALTSIHGFLNQLDGLNSKAQEFEVLLKKMVKNNFNMSTAVKSWQKLSKIVDGADLADNFFGWPGQDREGYVFQEKERKKGIKENPLAPVPDPEPIPYNYYEVYNNITDQAKQYEQKVRRELEMFAGQLVDSMGNIDKWN